jgi:hypothetical protein
MSESLFSLEVVVNYIKIQHEKISCLFPCVAFRLLDYPSIAIHFLDDTDSRQLKQQLEINQSYQPDLKITHFRDLLDKHDRYIFAKGKSCLFRSELAVLRGHLRNAPLYVMLLDTYQEPYKLLGTSAVPLTNVIEQICEELYETSLDMPCTKITHGVFDIKNLMGEDIGHISFACRLSSFGSTLLPHIGVTNEAIERQVQLKKVSNQTAKPKEVIVKKIERDNDTQLAHSLVQTVPIDYKTAQIQISNADFLPDRVDCSTQMEVVQVKTTKTTVVKKVIEDEFVFNHYCPPPLQYNAEQIKKTTITTSSNVASAIVQNMKVIKERKYVVNEYEKKRIDYLNEAVDNQIVPEFDNEVMINQEDDNDDDEGYISNQQHLKLKSKEQVKTNFDLDDFPILKCLVDEISKLKLLGTSRSEVKKPSKDVQKSPRPKSAAVYSNIEQNRKLLVKSTAVSRPNLVGILKDRNKKQYEQPKMNKEAIIESVNRLSRPRSAIVSKQNNDLAAENNKKKESKPKLTFGTTKAHRMRVLASRPDKADKINEEHSLLINKLKQNLEEIPDSSQNITPRSSFGKKDQTDLPYNINHLSISNSTYNNNNSKSPLDLSLLNKVEMESTIDYALSRNIMNNFNFNSQDIHLAKLSLQQSSNPQSSSIGQNNTKFVQFGNTVVFNHPSDESGTPATATNTSTTTTTNSLAKNQFQRKSPRSQTSSLSSSKSKHTSDDFEDEDDSIRMSQINENIDNLIGLSSKYSSNDFCTETTKSKEDENIFSRDFSRTST